MESSTMQTNRLDAPARTFSRVKAPPPPLMSCNRLLASSAPSTYRSSPPVSFSTETSNPAFSSSRVDSRELETTRSTRSRTDGSRSINSLTVEPLPTPSTVPGSINLNEACATFLFLPTSFMTHVRSTPNTKVPALAGTLYLPGRKPIFPNGLKR